MPRRSHPGPQHHSVPEDAARAALARILRSQTFSRSPRLRGLLEFAVEESIAGRGGELKEYALGVAVFNRGDDFDPRTDTIVRVEFRRLRLRLEEYYRSEGGGDAVRIELRRGSYAASLAPMAPQPSPDRLPEPPAWKGNLWTGGVILLVAGVTLLWWGGVGHAPPSVAVLPFANLTGRPPDDVLAQGLADELIDSLTRNDGLRTIARGSSRKAMAGGTSHQTAGGRLGVSNVVSGTVRREGCRVRVTARLIRVADGASLRAGAYERETADPFGVEDELSRLIAEAIAEKLGVRPSPAGRPHTPSPAVNRLYLQGRYLWNRRTPASARESIRFFEQAVAKDPRFALAHAALADSWAVLAMNGQAPAPDAAARAKAAASAALRIDASLGEARAAAAWLRFFHDWDFAPAQQEFERALKLRPGYATARQWFGLALLARGEFGRAIRQFESALDLDPLSLIVLTDIAVAHYYQRRYDLAVQRAQDALRLDAQFHYAQLIPGAALLQGGRRGEALAYYQSALAVDGASEAVQKAARQGVEGAFARAQPGSDK